MLEAKEGELGASCRALPRQHWLLPAVEAEKKVLRPSSVGALSQGPSPQDITSRKPPGLNN